MSRGFFHLFKTLCKVLKNANTHFSTFCVPSSRFFLKSTGSHTDAIKVRTLELLFLAMSIWYPVKQCYESSPGHQRKGDWTEQLPIAHVHWPCQGHKFWSWENQFAFLSRLLGTELFSLSWCRWRTATLTVTVGSGLLGKVLSSSDCSMV